MWAVEVVGATSSSGSMAPPAPYTPPIQGSSPPLLCNTGWSGGATCQHWVLVWHHKEASLHSLESKPWLIRYFLGGKALTTP